MAFLCQNGGYEPWSKLRIRGESRDYMGSLFTGLLALHKDFEQSSHMGLAVASPTSGERVSFGGLRGSRRNSRARRGRSVMSIRIRGPTLQEEKLFHVSKARLQDLNTSKTNTEAHAAGRTSSLFTHSSQLCGSRAECSNMAGVAVTKGLFPCKPGTHSAGSQPSSYKPKLIKRRSHGICLSEASCFGVFLLRTSRLEQ